MGASASFNHTSSKKFPFLLAGNWKMYKSPQESEEFLREFSEFLPNRTDGQEFLIFPPALCLDRMIQARTKTKTLQKLQLGLQNCYFKKEGAFTGENSASVARAMGAEWCLVGHSERRSLFNESDLELSSKVEHLLKTEQMKVIFCVGESLAERDQGLTLSVLENQWKVLGGVVSGFDFDTLTDRLVLAYEPVWAIGTGRVAEPSQVQEAHEFLKKITNGLRVLYGGSVKSENAAILSSVTGVDGFLIGGASLAVKNWIEISRQMVQVSI